jgi:hypothetical protein
LMEASHRCRPPSPPRRNHSADRAGRDGAALAH